jgi:hypothetical protein
MTELKKVVTTTLYDVEFEGQLYRLVIEQDHILDKLECTLFDIDGEVQSDELVDKILNPLN